MEVPWWRRGAGPLRTMFSGIAIPIVACCILGYTHDAAVQGLDPHKGTKQAGPYLWDVLEVRCTQP